MHVNALQPFGDSRAEGFGGSQIIIFVDIKNSAGKFGPSFRTGIGKVIKILRDKEGHAPAMADVVMPADLVFDKVYRDGARPAQSLYARPPQKSAQGQLPAGLEVASVLQGAVKVFHCGENEPFGDAVRNFGISRAGQVMFD